MKLEQVAALTPGFTGADLANLVNEAALVATRRGAEEVSMEDFNVAIERIVAGLEKKNRLLNPREREIVAHHEMGHALVAAALPGCDPVHKISIIPRGIGALGYTIQRPTEDRYLMTREELEDEDGGAARRARRRALVFGHLSTGAADDLSKATDIARNMVTRYGMGERARAGDLRDRAERLPRRRSPGRGGSTRRRPPARSTSRCATSSRPRSSGRARSSARNRALLDESARELLARETLADAELAAVLGRVPQPQERGRRDAPGGVAELARRA